jgi:PAT family beta-lactamase induction signal transducer AmpG
MAVLMGILAVVTFLAPSPLRLAEAPKSLKESVVGPLKEFFSNPSALTILAFIILYKLGDNLAGSMTIPFILKNGYTKLEYVAISKGVGFVGILIGSLLGGFIVLRLKIHRSLWLMGFLQAVSTFGFALLAGHDKNLMALSAVMFFENLTAGMGTSAFTAFMASVTNVKFTATQYALLSSLMGVPRVIFASRTGVIAEQMGWFGFFNFCTLIAIPGMFLILFLEKPPTSGWKKWLHHFLIAITIAAGIYATIASVIDLLGLK